MRRADTGARKALPGASYCEIVWAVQEWLGRAAALTEAVKWSAWYLTQQAMVTVTPAAQRGQILWPANAGSNSYRIEGGSSGSDSVRIHGKCRDPRFTTDCPARGCRRLARGFRQDRAAFDLAPDTITPWIFLTRCTLSDRGFALADRATMNS